MQCNNELHNHEKSACHCVAVEVMITLPSTTCDIGEQLSQQHAAAAQKLRNRQALYQILSSINFLFRQRIALRGDGSKSDGNFRQLKQRKIPTLPNDDQERECSGRSRGGSMVSMEPFF